MDGTGFKLIDTTNQRVLSYQSVPGYVICLSCDRKFLSPDKLRIRVCTNCKNGRECTGRAADNAVVVHGIEIIERDVFPDEN